MSELEKLKAQNAELSERIAKLEEANKPAEPFVPEPRVYRDLTAGACMPPSALLEMLKVTPDDLMAALRGDARRPNPVTTGSSPIKSTPSAQSEPQRRGTGWAPEIPLSSPPGVASADRLMDAQDQIDKVELAKKLAETEAALKTATGSGGK